MNKVVLMGRLTRDPEAKNGTMTVARYSLAVQRRFKREGEPEADFINCVAFGKQGEFAEKYFRQGMKIAISGRIQTGSYVNKDGQKVFTTDIIVEEQDFCESKNASPTSKPAPANAGNGFVDVPGGLEEELPFN